MKTRHRLERLAVALAVCLPLSPASAEQGDLSMIGVPLERAAGYVEGAAAAIAHANMTLALEGRPPLYCDPSFGPSAAEFYDLANTNLVGPHEPTLFIFAALDALRERYPCD